MIADPILLPEPLASASPPSPVPRAEDIPAPAENRIILHGLTWAQYRQISSALDGRHFRIAFDRGALELMTISSKHGSVGRLLGLMVQALSEFFQLPFMACGDMTCDREDLERGVEADDTYYLTNEHKVRGKEAIDLNVDPPPDLMLEIDVSRSSLNRFPIYAALQVPEIWRWRPKALTIHRLGADHQYQEAAESRFFPGVTAVDLFRFLEMRHHLDVNGVLKAFRDWLAANIKK